MVGNIDETPMGWEINLLFMMAHCASVLAADVDMQLRMKTKNQYDRFDKKKKKCFFNYEKAIKEAEEWFQKMEIDKSTYEAVEENNKRYSNAYAHANWLIRVCMLALDRSHCDGGDARVMKRLRSLPEVGIFSEKMISRFNMKFEIVPEVGDHVMTNNHGEGILLLHLGQSNWNVRLVDGSEIVLNEKQFKLL